jgi:hypothetical protein
LVGGFGLFWSTTTAESALGLKGERSNWFGEESYLAKLAIGEGY